MLNLKRISGIALAIWLPFSFALYGQALRKVGGNKPFRVSNVRAPVLFMTATSADAVVDQQLKEKASDSIESLWKDVYAVAIPAMAACVVEPALSLVDTYYVGKSKDPVAATRGLAGMSINSALFNIIAAATAPLGTATTSIIAKLRGELVAKSASSDLEKATAAAGAISDDDRVKTTFLNGVTLVTILGTFLTTIILAVGNVFLRHTFNIKGELLSTTNTYLQIRGLSLPSVLMNYIVFGFSLAMQDILAPILSISTAFWVNVLGDFLLVGKLGKGLAGAAAATTLSSYLGSAISLIYLLRKYNFNLKLKFKLPRRVDPVTGKEVGIDWGKIRKLRVIDKSSASVFFTASGALLAGSLANTLTYSAGARISSFTSSAAQSTVEIAAHHVVMQVWWFLSYFSSPFNLVAQAVFPRDLVAKNPRRVKAMAMLLLKISVAVGLLMTGINVALPLWLPHAFTRDIAVQQAVRGVTIQSGLSMLLICIATVLDGIYIGSGGLLDYVRVCVLSTAVAWIYYAYSISQRLGLTGTWNGLLIFSATRLIYYLIRFPGLWRRISSAEDKQDKDLVMVGGSNNHSKKTV